jgi:predicted deacetylase
MTMRAVTLHDIDPATFARSAEVRDWLTEHGVERATLLVIPAAAMRAFDARSPELAAWLLERTAAGDAVAQHGFRHKRQRRAAPPRGWIAEWQGGEAAEFPGLSRNGTTAAVRAGRSVMTDAGIEPRGFVAPGFAYTPALRRELDSGFEWWASRTRVHCSDGTRVSARARTMGTSSSLKRALSPLAFAAGPLRTRLLRIEVHPQDFDFPRHVQALERLLSRSAGRRDVTYDELLAG